MKALKSHPHIERPRRINNQITVAQHTAGLVLALVDLISAALMKGPIQRVSAETVALGWRYTGFIRLSRVLWLSVTRRKARARAAMSAVFAAEPKP